MSGNTLQYWLGVLRKSSNRSELSLAVFVVLVLSLMVFALPPLLLDALIAINILLSVALLFLAVGVRNPLELSTFPTLILLTKLFRLALNISSSKQILLTGDAGHIIETFGRLVVGGSLLIGAVIFIIISLVQFIVVAKGSERVAEVSARFTLDAMPGKQMSIDADLRAGSLTKDEAKKRRTELERESQFHGAMDGAMKFVKGDSIAAMVIAAINVVAGMLVGTVVHDLDFATSLTKYSVLAIGDGMVSQIPSLLSAIGAGILVTRVGESEMQDPLGADSGLAGRIGSQILSQPKTLLYAGGASLAFSLVPGFPWYIFLIGAILMIFSGSRRAGKQQSALSDFSFEVPEFKAESGKKAIPYVTTEKGLTSPSLLVEIHPDLLGALRRDNVTQEIVLLRQSVHSQLGILFPGFSLIPSIKLAPNSFRVLIHDIAGPIFFVRGSQSNVLADPSQLPWQIMQFDEAIRMVKWTSPAASLNKDLRYSPERFIALVTLSQICSRAGDLIAFQEAQDWLNRAMEIYPDLANEFLRSVSVQRLADVLKLLASDRIPLRSPRLVIEGILVHANREKEASSLTEKVRIYMAKIIYSGLKNDAAELKIALLEHSVEEMLVNVVGDEHDLEIALQDSTWEAAIASIIAKYRESASLSPPVLVVSAQIRRVMQSYLRLKGLDIWVLSKAEIPDDAQFITEWMLCSDLGLPSFLGSAEN